MMRSPKTLGLLVCKNFRNEFQHVIKKLDYSDIVLASYRSSCAHGGNDDNLAAVHAHIKQRCDEVKLISPLSCTNCSQGFCRAQFFADQTCLEYFIPTSIMQYFIAQGKYLVTPGWLFDWESTVKDKWAFKKEQAQDFFKETANEIVVLDTGVYPDFSDHLKSLSEFINLKYSIVPVGLDYLELKLSSLILDWRKSNDNQQLLSQRKEWQLRLANFMMLYDVIPKLAAKDNEKELLQVVEELLHSLLAPKRVSFYQSDFATNVTKKEQRALETQFDFPGTLDWDEDKADIRIKVQQQGESLLYIYVKELLYPQHFTVYLEVIEIITNFLGLFILNARQNEMLRSANQEAIKHEKEMRSANQALFLANSELKLAKEEAEKAVATKDKFFSIIAHDLRSPFNGMMGFSSILNESYDDLSRSEHLEYLGIINTSLINTLKLLEDLLAWSRAQRGAIPFRPEKIIIKSFVDGVQEEFFQSVQAKSVKILNTAPAELEMWADKDLMRVVLRNLIGNAIKFTPRGGEISIGCSKLPESKMTEIQVCDSGLGMSPEKIKSLFDVGKNSSTPGTEQEKGSGLGLILCKEFVDIHNGIIKVQSELGKGSCFTVCIPEMKANSK
jgi:signal transduction histidine kinase